MRAGDDDVEVVRETTCGDDRAPSPRGVSRGRLDDRACSTTLSRARCTSAHRALCLWGPVTSRGGGVGRGTQACKTSLP